MIFLESYTIIESENVIFFEHLFPLKNKEKVLHESVDTSNDLVDDVQELRRSKRARNEKGYGNNFFAYIVEDKPISNLMQLNLLMHHFGWKLLIVN